MSAEETARYFGKLDASPGEPTVERHADKALEDGARVETWRWVGQEHDVALMIVHGGGHSLPHPSAPFPSPLVGRTSRDLDGAAAIWAFFLRRMGRN